MKLTQVDMFSGIGGMLLGGERAGFTPVLGCEIEPFCRSMLYRHFPKLPILEDIHDFEAKGFKRGIWGGGVTVLTGAFPFQTNYSRGNARRNDPRSLWGEFARVVYELQPHWVVVETIPRLATLGLDEACWDLERAGYAPTAIDLPAQALDCPLRKDRLWIVGSLRADPRPLGDVDAGLDLDTGAWERPEPGVHRVAERFPHGLDWHVAALHALGDATVPRSAEIILRGIRDTELEWLKTGTAKAS